MKVAILGSGAYGLALASRLLMNKNDVEMWTYSKEEKEQLKETRISNKLPGYKIPKEIKITTSMKKAVYDSKIIIIAVPAFAVDDIAKKLSKYIKPTQHILIATKGIEQDTCKFLTDVVLDYINTNRLAVISGPTFAVDIIKDVPIGLSLGTTNELTKKTIMQAFINPKTKLRPTLDIIGIEVCGAIKNVMAIASGMLEGMNVPDSTKALFLTEALNDIKEIIDVLGGNKKTILSFAGFGDILMTCTSQNSRNFTFGKILGSGKKEEAIKYRENTTVEGLYTLKSIQKLLQDTGACIPIIDLIYEIIYNDKDKEEMLKFLIEK